MEKSFYKDEDPVPKNLADVLKSLKRTIAIRRREDGFDLSGPEKPWGEFTVFKGGSHYYNYCQDQRLQQVLECYKAKHQGKDMVHLESIERMVTSNSHVGRLSSTCKSHSLRLKDSIKMETDRLLATVAQMIIEESCVPLDGLDMCSTTTGSSVCSLSSCNSTPSRKNERKRKTSSSSSVSNGLSNSRPNTPTSVHSRTTSASSARSTGSHHRHQSGKYWSPVAKQPSHKSLSSLNGTDGVSTHINGKAGSSAAKKTFNTIGTCTDVVTAEASTQTNTHTDTQTELSFLAGKKPPLKKESPQHQSSSNESRMRRQCGPDQSSHSSNSSCSTQDFFNQ